MLSRSFAAHLAAALTASAALLAGSAPAASAGTYTVTSCTGANPMFVGWTNSSTDFNSFDVSSDCLGGRLSSSFDVYGYPPAAIPDGARHTWTFSAPPNTTIYHAKLTSSGNVRVDGAFVRLDWGTPDGASTPIVEANSSGGSIGEIDTSPASGTTTSLSAVVGCSQAGGCAAADANRNPGVQLSIGGSQVTLEDEHYPTGSVIVEDDTSPAVMGLIYNVADQGGGVQRVGLYLDGTLIEENDPPCTIGALVPCPLSASGRWTFDTSKVPAGLHDLSIRVTDVSGNVGYVWDSLTSMPVTMYTSPGSDPGSSGTSASTTSGSITSPASTPTNTLTGSTNQAAQAAAQPNGTGASLNARLVLSTQRLTKRVGFGKPTVITGRLIDAAGKPIAGAILSVTQRTALPGAALADIANVVSGPDGRFTYLAPAGPSRLIQFGYRAFTGDTAFAATTAVNLVVSAGVTLKASKTKLPNHQATVFTGRLLAKPNGKRGVVVDLQVLFRGHWRTIADPRTNAKGAFNFRYRFMAGAARWKFRARVRADAAYPYTLGYSAKPVWVRVL